MQDEQFSGKALRDAFFEWLAKEVSDAQLSELFLSATDLDSFCKSKRLVSGTIFELTNQASISKLRVRLESDRIFKFFNRGKTPKMLLLLKFYTRYLEERKETEKTAQAVSVPVIAKPEELTTIESVPTDQAESAPRLQEQLVALATVSGTIVERSEPIEAVSSETDPFFEYLLSIGYSEAKAEGLYTALNHLDCYIANSPDHEEQIRSAQNDASASRILSSLLADRGFYRLNRKNNDLCESAARLYIRMLRERRIKEEDSFQSEQKESPLPLQGKPSIQMSQISETQVPVFGETPAQVALQLAMNGVEEDPLIAYANRNMLMWVDKRAQNGCFWLIGDMRISNHIENLRTMGYSFRFALAGSKSTDGKKAWYLIGAESAERPMVAETATRNSATPTNETTEAVDMVAHAEEVIRKQRSGFYDWLKASDTYKKSAVEVYCKLRKTDRLLQSVGLLDESIYLVVSIEELVRIQQEAIKALKRNSVDEQNRSLCRQALQCYQEFLEEQLAQAASNAQEELPANKEENDEPSVSSKPVLVDELSKLLAEDDLQELRDALVNQGILTMEQFKATNLWAFMNRHALYNISQRQEIHKRIVDRMKPGTPPEPDLQYCLKTHTATYCGATPAEAFLGFCEHMAQKYPLKIRSLLDAKFIGIGAVVLSRTDQNGDSLKLMSPEAYIAKDLTGQAVIDYGQWICKMCGETDRPESMGEPKPVEQLAIAEPVREAEAEETISDVYNADVSPRLQPREPVRQEPIQPVPPVVKPVTSEITSSWTRAASRTVEKAEKLVLRADLNGMTLDELADEVRTTVVAVKRAVADSRHIVQLGSKLFHDEAFVDWEDGADQMERILDKLLDKNGGYVSAAQFVEFVRADMQMFLNDNDLDEPRMIFDMAQHLFEKIDYHGKHLTFQAKSHISRGETAVATNLDVICNFAREQGGFFREEDLIAYLQSVGIKTGNIRGQMQVYVKPNFLFYAERTFITSESMGLDDEWFVTARKALDNLFGDMGDHVVLRDIQPWWYTQLPSLPGGREWTALLLQSILRHFSKKLNARTIYGLYGQNSDTLHAMLVDGDSEIQTFADAVIAFLVDDQIEQRRFEAEELRQMLVQRGMIAGNELIWNMPKALAKDERFAWDADERHVTVKV